MPSKSTCLPPGHDHFGCCCCLPSIHGKLIKMAAMQENDSVETTSANDSISIEDDISNGILQLLKPAVEEVDNRVLHVR